MTPQQAAFPRIYPEQVDFEGIALALAPAALDSPAPPDEPTAPGPEQLGLGAVQEPLAEVRRTGRRTPGSRRRKPAQALSPGQMTLF